MNTVYIGISEETAISSLFKIGRTVDYMTRQREIRNMNPSFRILYTFEVEDSHQVEKMLHERFAAKRYVGEWFCLSAQDVANLCNEYTKSNDYTAEYIREEVYLALGYKVEHGTEQDGTQPQPFVLISEGKKVRVL